MNSTLHEISRELHQESDVTRKAINCIPTAIALDMTREQLLETVENIIEGFAKAYDAGHSHGLRAKEIEDEQG